MSSFLKVKRGWGDPAKGLPLFTIRERQVAFNADFAKLAELNTHKYVTFYTADEQRRIRMEFSAIPSEDAYRVTQDGGGSAVSGRAAQAGSLVAKPWVASVARQSPSARRFIPEKVDGKNTWEVSLMPSFETRVEDANEIPSAAQGIYRYLDKEGDVVYIGRGSIRERAKEPYRKSWLYSIIEYSVIPDKSEQEEWERYWLDQFQDEHGALPAYNKILGTNSSPEPKKK
jgi:hypothetical protein